MAKKNSKKAKKKRFVSQQSAAVSVLTSKTQVAQKLSYSSDLAYVRGDLAALSTVIVGLICLQVGLYAAFATTQVDETIRSILPLSAGR